MNHYENTTQVVSGAFRLLAKRHISNFQVGVLDVVMLKSIESLKLSCPDSIGAFPTYPNDNQVTKGSFSSLHKHDVALTDSNVNLKGPCNWCFGTAT